MLLLHANSWKISLPRLVSFAINQSTLTVIQESNLYNKPLLS